MAGIEPYGDIGEKWRALKNVGWDLGPPKDHEHGWPAASQLSPRIQFFEWGTIGWFPAQGHHMTTIIHRVDERRVEFAWGSTSPFHYDKFLVRWHAGTGWRQEDVSRHSDSGEHGPVGPDPDVGMSHLTIQFQVQGRDVGVFGGESKQGWTLPIPYDMW
jgi:hypothetical protein